ncbi:MAG: hypothetical protein LUD50_01565 [Clostridia bacterium]|nr:hypothetical protein [Clostridia bacterium]
MNKLTLKLDLQDSVYNTAIRLVAGAVCMINDEDVDDIEDFKVCVTESLLILKSCGYEQAVCLFSADGGTLCEIRGLGGTPCEGENNELSLALIPALVSRCDIRKNGSIIESIELEL